MKTRQIDDKLTFMPIARQKCHLRNGSGGNEIMIMVVFMNFTSGTVGHYRDMIGLKEHNLM